METKIVHDSLKKESKMGEKVGGSKPSQNSHKIQDGKTFLRSPAFTITQYVNDVVVTRHISPFGVPTGADLESRRGYLLELDPNPYLR